MPWGPKSMRPALNFRVYEKVPPARKVPYDPSIFIPLGINMLPLPNCPVADPASDFEDSDLRGFNSLSEHGSGSWPRPSRNRFRIVSLFVLELFLASEI